LGHTMSFYFSTTATPSRAEPREETLEWTR
jgi:hypothetical protein